MSIRSLLLVLALASMPAAAGDVYKWTDAGGVVHYSDAEPAAELKAQRLHLSENQTSAVADAAANPAAARSTTDDPPDGPQGNPVPGAERQCADARNNLELLQSRSTPGLDAQGGAKPEDLAGPARQQQIARAQTLIATYCK